MYRNKIVYTSHAKCVCLSNCKDDFFHLTHHYFMCVCVCVWAHKYLWLNFHHYCDNDTQTEKNVLASSSFLGGTFIPNCVFCALGLFVPCGHLSLWVLTKLSSDVHPSSCCTCGEVAFREFCECVSFRWGKESSQLPPPRGDIWVVIASLENWSWEDQRPSLWSRTINSVGSKQKPRKKDAEFFAGGHVYY